MVNKRPGIQGCASDQTEIPERLGESGKRKMLNVKQLSTFLPLHFSKPAPFDLSITSIPLSPLLPLEAPE